MTHDNPVGILLAQRLTNALTLMGVPYDSLVRVVYGTMSEVDRELNLGDWIEFPSGNSYVKESAIRVL